MTRATFEFTVMRLQRAILFALIAAWPTVRAADAPPPSPPPFDLWEIRVLGNSVLEPVVIERTVYPFLGPSRTIKDVEAARTALEKVFHDSGFGTVFVDIPEQDVTDNVVRLHVTEGRLDLVRVKGARYFPSSELRARLPTAAPGTVPHLPTLQKELAAVNAMTADQSVAPVLKAGSAPGSVDLELQVKDQLPLHGSLELNNAYTADTTKLRAVTSIGYDNVFGRMDSVSLQYQASPQAWSEVSVLALTYAARLPDSDARLAGYYIRSDSEVVTVGALGVLGKGNIAGLRYINPIQAGPGSSHTLTLGLDYKDFTEDIQLDADNSVRTPITYVNWLASYALATQLGVVGFNGEASANVGVRGIANDPGEFADKRYRGRPNYFYVRGDVQFAVPLPLRSTLRLGLAGQGAIEPVIPNEQFPIGGSSGTRGYLDAEALGDNGFRLSMQLLAPPSKLFGDRFSYEYYGFADYGLVSTMHPLPDEPRSTDLAGVGLGIDFHAPGNVIGTLAWAYPLLDGPITEAGDSRIHFSLRTTW